jgi:hypothetical protein
VVSPEKLGDGLSLSSMPLPGVVLAKRGRITWERGSVSPKVHGRVRAPSRQTMRVASNEVRLDFIFLNGNF